MLQYAGAPYWVMLATEYRIFVHETMVDEWQDLLIKQIVA